MFEKPYYISPHAIEQFRGRCRVGNGLSAKTIRNLILYILNTTQPIKYQKYNKIDQPIYEGEFDNIKFWIPVIQESRKQKGILWNVVTTILLPGMKIYNERGEKFYVNAQDLARDIKVDRTTVAEMINKGQIKALRHNKGDKYRIPENEAKKIKNSYNRPVEKWYKKWSETDIHILINNKDKTACQVAEMIKRNENSVKIERCRLRKEGYDV
jgi:arginine repressor